MTRACALLLALAILANAGPAAAAQEDIAELRASTAHFHSNALALAEGYGVLRDAAGIACIEQPGEGAMGIHFVNGPLVGDPTIEAERPEVVIYEPMPNGQLRLVAVEYVVMQADWHATHAAPPTLFGHTFHLVPAGNRYGLPAFYELHAWVWKRNPSGMFHDWNPRVSCATTE